MFSKINLMAKMKEQDSTIHLSCTTLNLGLRYAIHITRQLSYDIHKQTARLSRPPPS